ncbi:oxidoreductase, partial [bacterium]|nr:oxidoreductase [bacterium]
TFTVSRVYPIIAIKRNGKTMNVRDNGPYRVIYPYDDDPSLKNEIIYARSVVMLSEINVLE